MWRGCDSSWKSLSRPTKWDVETIQNLFKIVFCLFLNDCFALGLCCISVHQLNSSERLSGCLLQKGKYQNRISRHLNGTQCCLQTKRFSIGRQMTPTRVCKKQLWPSHSVSAALTAVCVPLASLTASLFSTFTSASTSSCCLFSLWLVLCLPSFFSPCWSIHWPDWQVITSQVTAAYSKSWEVIKIYFNFFIFLQD